MTNPTNPLDPSAIAARIDAINAAYREETMTNNAPLTPAALAEIEARANAATPGPWTHSDANPWSPKQKSPFADFGASISGAMGSEICTGGSQDEQGGAVGVLLNEDAAFIAHARTDIPALLAEVKRLAAENERLRDAERIAWALARGYLSGGKAHASIYRMNGSACWHFNLRGKDIVLGAGEFPDFERTSDPSLIRAAIDAARAGDAPHVP